MTAAPSLSQIRVRYAETDQMGFAYHGNYFAWFEVARTDLLRHYGLTYRELEAADLRLPVISTEVKFLRPALYDDVLTVSATVVQFSGARVTFAYEVHREGSPGPLATARTEHAAVDHRGRPRRFPEELRKVLA